jgi:benzoyl-CoA reductase/2-hydroxyglutaryl-CoA dehydratase subunit BcrC/BadD/HgdB
LNLYLIFVRRIKINTYIKHLRSICGLSGYQELESIRLDTQRVLTRAEKYFLADKRIFTTTLIPSEILLNFGVASLDSEEVAPIIESIGGRKADEHEECIAAALNLGLERDVCPYPLITIGAFERNFIPVPDAFIGSSYLCNDQYEMLKLLSYRYEKPCFILDIPYWHDINMSVARYVEEQLVELIDFLSNVLKKPFDKKEFSNIIECSNNTFQLIEKIKEIRHGNNKISGSIFIYLYGSQVLFGDKDNYKVYLKLYEECMERQCVKHGDFRALWINALPLRKKSLINTLEKRNGVDIVYDINSTCNIGPVNKNNPLSSLALKLLSGIFLDGIERRQAVIKKVIKDFRIDFAMGFSYSRCKLPSGGFLGLREVFQQEKIPFLNWQVESISGTEIPDERVLSDIENMMHILKTKGSGNLCQ